MRGIVVDGMAKYASANQIAKSLLMRHSEQRMVTATRIRPTVGLYGRLEVNRNT